MTDIKWTIKGRSFTNCNCAYGCPCQFNALPTHGHCRAIAGIAIDEGKHGDTRLDGLTACCLLAWPGPIHLGKGEVVVIVDEKATSAQRDAILRILSGQDTEPGATIFQVFSTTYEKVYDPIFARIEFDFDLKNRRARLMVPGLVASRCEPVVNAVTKEEQRMRIELPRGFEYKVAEVGRGWVKTQGSIKLDLADTHAHFINLHMTQSGVVN